MLARSRLLLAAREAESGEAEAEQRERGEFRDRRRPRGATKLRSDLSRLFYAINLHNSAYFRADSIG